MTWKQRNTNLYFSSAVINFYAMLSLKCSNVHEIRSAFTLLKCIEIYFKKCDKSCSKFQIIHGSIVLIFQNRAESNIPLVIFTSINNQGKTQCWCDTLNQVETSDEFFLLGLCTFIQSLPQKWRLVHSYQEVLRLR